MFTGIVEEMGSVAAIKRGAKSSVLTISGDVIFDDMGLGDSIAVNGVCLTVTRFADKRFDADVMNETLSRSSLGDLALGSRVNLERATPMNGRFGGHIVSGHIDGVGTVAEITRDDNAIWYRIAVNPEVMRYIVEKGSVALDGISLTVAKLSQGDFSVSIIPHTVENTVLSQKKVGDIINVENDVIGKYVERLMSNKQPDEQQSSITLEFLSKHGF
ncbi:MAG: riboflavin synthase [Raoultibacter sp.]|jgi:riboflavin synthase